MRVVFVHASDHAFDLFKVCRCIQCQFEALRFRHLGIVVEIGSGYGLLMLIKIQGALTSALT